MTPAVDLQLGVILSNTYKITAKLGEGGMGSVYRADHQRLPRPYAIKVLHETVEPDSEFYHRFRREAEICSRLRHENIVEVVDFNFTPDGRPYIAMELLDGEDLEARLDRHGRLSETETLAIVGQIASGLAEAHEQGVIHRDLKPQNIFLCKRRKGGDRVKIVDFGISKIQGSVSVLTAAFSLVGTPYYMSPEQTGAGDGQVTARSDLYALGVIAYQMLSGEMPIVGESLAKIVMSINTQRPRPLRELVPQLSPAVEAVIDVALAKDPLRRFGSAADFHEALRRAVEIGDLMGISPDDSVAETVAAGGVAQPEGATSAPANLNQTSAYDERAFHTPSGQQTPGPADGASHPGMGPTVRTPYPQGLGGLASSAASAVQAGVGSSPSASADPAPVTIRERPAGAGVESPAPATPATDNGAVSKTTLSSAAGESQMTTELPRPASSRGKVLAVIVVVGVLVGVGVGAYLFKSRGTTGSGEGGSTGAMAPDTTAMKPAAAPARRIAVPRAARPLPGPTRVVILLKGLPVGGRCTVEGKPVEGNPLVIPRGQKAVRLRCEAKAHRPVSTDLIPDRDRTIPLTFEPQRKVAVSPPRRRPGQRSMRPRRRPMRRPMRAVMRVRARPIDSDIPIE